jgi:hypothetical protein
LKRYSLRLLVAFLLTSVAVAPVLFWLRDLGFFLLPEDAADGYLVAISMFDGFALAGLIVMLRFFDRDSPFLKRVGALVLALLVCTAVRVLIADTHPDPVFLVLSAVWEAARAIAAAFAVAFVAHAMMARYLPSTMLRVRDITPMLTEGRAEGKPSRRVKHAKRSRWIFDMGSREYLDSRGLRLETQDVRGFAWDDWGRVALWASIGLFALSIYAEVYPRAANSIDILWNAVITGHLLAIVPILVLPMLPIKALGPRIPVGDGEYCLATGFSIQLTRWLKIAFFPIIAVGLLFRVIPWDNAVELMQALLVTIPTALLTCMVYITCFRERTVAEIHRGIRERERVEEEEFGPEPWRETSLLEGVDIVEADFYLE